MKKFHIPNRWERASGEDLLIPDTEGTPAESPNEEEITWGVP